MAGIIFKWVLIVLGAGLLLFLTFGLLLAYAWKPWRKRRHRWMSDARWGKVQARAKFWIDRETTAHELHAIAVDEKTDPSLREYAAKREKKITDSWDYDL